VGDIRKWTEVTAIERAERDYIIDRRFGKVLLFAQSLLTPANVSRADGDEIVTSRLELA